ncbi:glycosyl transferase [Thermosipho sp. 1063]|uniref:glycosyltransferase family 4 protein n=1 Tax=unclassified Thermosipho (in: thermotogales) TaxID=2676525 RepID=UPI0009493BDA|nr:MULTISPECIES: MraY family glycosyltransferase [unclassified Thermosipho (in: thermotogales)]ANQ53617.1 glycosyl transferase [Thermosipho sp. 1070]APT72064.1 glycosyl transferase [Thermosipho sp. 1063]OOC44174.1 glycosyl transferase [Thermosipho sp. 1074]
MNIIIYFLVTILVLIISKKLNLFMDYPTQRKNHTLPTPQIGGIILFILLAIYSKNSIFILLLLLLFGILDDMIKLSYKQKFVFEFLIAVYFVWKHKLTLFGYQNIFTDIFAIVWIVAFFNGINMIDGFNGLSTGVSIIYFSTIGKFDISLMYLPIFIFNFYGKLFMGESGVLITGYLLLSSILKMENEMVFLTIFFGYPFYEVVASFTRRILSKENPFIADRKHLHHILHEKMGSAFLGISYLLAYTFTLFPRNYVSIIYYLSISLFIFFIHFKLTKEK